MKSPSERGLGATLRSSVTRNLLATVAVIIVAVIGTFVWWQYRADQAAQVADPTASVEPSGFSPESAGTRSSVVELTPEQLLAADLEISPVIQREMQEVRKIPGRIGYNENEYLPITSPVRGIVRAVDVLPGQAIERGDVLAVIGSSEIGSARSDVQLREAERDLAQQEYAWADEISRNVDSLLALLEQKPEMSAVEEAFQGKLLGKHRDDILTSYAKLRLAESATLRTNPLGEQRVISGRIVQERQSERDVAAADFQSVCEQTTLECIGTQRRAKVALDDADRQVTISKQHLAALCGPFSHDASLPDGNEWNDLPIRASMSGEVTKKNVVPGARLDVADLLFVLANTNTLWVSAELREADWQTLKIEKAATVQVATSAIPDRTFLAQIRFVGSEISESTRSLPLVAELENAEGLLKPGLFVWVAVPAGPMRRAIAVPSAGVLRHEGQSFVFVVDRPGRYRRVDVEVGLETPDWTEIRGGLAEGTQVVGRGAFYLKSELLLE